MIHFDAIPVLENARVQLRPFREADIPALRQLTMDPEIWRFMVNRISNEEELQEWVSTVEEGYRQGTRYTFLIEDRETGQLAGSTSYGNISWIDKRLEIGWTWLGSAYRGTGLNRHCKFLLLQYAFEVLELERVELKTDALNLRSRRAMEKIGAIPEGTLRSHTLMHDGRRRDTIYYSILRTEWPEIRRTIFADLAA